MKFATIDVTTRVFTGPRKPSWGIISRGRIRSETPKTPRAGSHTLLRIRFHVSVDVDTYSTHALQKVARRRLKRGARIHPKRLKRKWLKDGTRNARAKLKRVRSVAWTTPNVRRTA
jgi:hypothetical protein